MAQLARILALLVLLAIAAFCGYGFFASFEPPGNQGARSIYGIAGCGCLAGIAAFFWPRLLRSPGKEWSAESPRSNRLA